jgi:hypothetical protein
MSSQPRVKLIFHLYATVASCFCALRLLARPTAAEPLPIAHPSIAVVHGPLWLTKHAGLFKKYNIKPEFIYVAGATPSLQALIAAAVGGGALLSRARHERIHRCAL